MTQDEYVAELRRGRADAQRQIGYFKKGMRFLTNGVDRTDSHRKTLEKIVANYDKLLEVFDA